MSEVERIPGRFGAFETVRMGRGEPIVILPGMAGGWRLMAPLARLLARRHEVVLVGLRGDRGVAGRVEGQRPEDHAYDVSGVIDRLGLERPTIVGASFGGAIALEMAIRHPRSVGALAILGAEAKFRPTIGSAILVQALERFPMPRTSPFLNQFFNVLHGCRPQPGPIVDFLVDRCWETDQAVVAGRLRGLDEFDVTERLWEVDAPALVIAGTKDVVIPATRQRQLAEAIPGAVFDVLDGAGHAGFLTHRAEVASRVSRFVRGRVASYC